MNKFRFVEGTLVDGTVNPEHYVPVLIGAVRRYQDDNEDQFDFVTRDTHIDDLMRHLEYDYTKPWQHWWDKACESGDAEYLTDWLFVTLNRYAPEGCYFGSHPDDGADLGFWPFESDPVEYSQGQEQAGDY